MRARAVLLVLLLVGCSRGAEVSSSVVSALSSTNDTSGFARALRPRAFVFPRDAGPHLDFQTEWWYYTGNVDTPSARHFGYQLTIFRRALVPPKALPARLSRWASDQVYFAHLAVSDIASQRFHAQERWSRAALGLAGAVADPFEVWVESWKATADGDATRLQADAGDYAIDVKVRSLKPIVLQGEQGLSRKSEEPGNASYYYSATRLQTEGTIRVAGESFPVRGLSWFDREWSTSALSKKDSGWDWFALQASDGRELMLYHLRRQDGSINPVSAGTLVEADGTSHSLRASDYHIEVRSHWTSPRTQAVYPAAWRITVPSAAIDWSVQPLQPDQELPLTFKYWEGAVQFNGGSGYVELTGYSP